MLSMEATVPLSLSQLVRLLRAVSPNGRAIVGRRQIRRAIAQGQLPASAIGNRLLVRPADVMSWIADQQPVLDVDPELRERARHAAAARASARARGAPQ